MILFLSFSTKHHPDKPGGDVDTFRTLKRAQTVLSNPKLRQQYDILGLDLDDDEVEQNNSSGDNEDDAGAQTTTQGIIQDIASAALTTVLQFGVRTSTCNLNLYAIQKLDKNPCLITPSLFLPIWNCVFYDHVPRSLQ